MAPQQVHYTTWIIRSQEGAAIFVQSGMFIDGVYLAFLPGGAYTERARRVPMVPMGKH